MIDINCEKYSQKAKKSLIFIVIFILALLFKDFLGSFWGSIIVLVSGVLFFKNTFPYIRCISEYNKRNKF